jgi:hypothetical protein
MSEKRTVCCVHGANEQNLPITGKTVGWVRSNLHYALNLAPGAEALVGDHQVSEQYVLSAGETVEFLNRRGAKGVGRLWESEAQIKQFFRLTEQQYQHWRSLGMPVHEFPDGRVLMTETDFDLWSASIHRPTPVEVEQSHPLPVESPYLTIEQAVRYLGKTRKAIYGLLDRGKLRKMEGSHVCYFTTDMLDDFLRGETTNGRGLRPGGRKKN